MRLIDADKLLEELRKYHPTIYGIFYDIKYSPTAYDVDKVIEQLEKASCYIEDGYGHAGHLVFTDEAIDIVKKGGAE